MLLPGLIEAVLLLELMMAILLLLLLLLLIGLIHGELLLLLLLLLLLFLLLLISISKQHFVLNILETNRNMITSEFCDEVKLSFGSYEGKKICSTYICKQNPNLHCFEPENGWRSPAELGVWVCQQVGVRRVVIGGVGVRLLLGKV